MHEHMDKTMAHVKRINPESVAVHAAFEPHLSVAAKLMILAKMTSTVNGPGQTMLRLNIQTLLKLYAVAEKRPKLNSVLVRVGFLALRFGMLQVVRPYLI